VARRSGAELARQRLPLAPGPKAIDDTCHHDAIRNRRPTAPRLWTSLREQRLNAFPQGVRKTREPCQHRLCRTLDRARCNSGLL
jgi:hypothetical protein